MKVTRIIHATVLAEIAGSNVLFDPWLIDKPGWRHREPVGLPLDSFPPVHAVVISHGHPDHFDLVGLAKVCSLETPLIVRLGLGARAKAAGFTNITELDHWQTAEPVEGVKITATPAKHSAPQNTYIIEGNGQTLFFGGDSRLIPEFAEVARRFPKIDVACLPVNGVRIFGIQTVMEPADAVEACRLLKPAWAVPIHYGMAATKPKFMFRENGTAEEFQALVSTSGLATQVRLLAPGEALVVGEEQPSKTEPSVI